MSDAARSISLPLGLRRSQRYFNQPFGDVPGGHSFVLVQTLEAPCDRVRLVYANDGVAPYTVTSAAIGIARENTTQTVWAPVTFNAGGRDLPSPSPAGGMRQVEVPGTANPKRPSLAYSDWTPVIGGTTQTSRLPVLLCRSFLANGGRAITPVPEHLASFNAGSAHCGRQIWGFHQPGNAVDAAADLSDAQQHPFMVPHMVQSLGRAPGATIFCVGDSLTRGQGSHSHYSSWGMRAAVSLSRPDRPVSFVNAGWSGQVSPDYLANGTAALAAIAPEITCIAPYTPNNVFQGDESIATADAAYYGALALAKTVRQSGGVAVLSTPLPWVSASMAHHLVRLGIVARVRALAAAGVPVLDFDRVLSTGGDRPGLRAEFDCGDGLHPNDAGYAAMTEEAVSVLGKILEG